MDKTETNESQNDLTSTMGSAFSSSNDKEGDDEVVSGHSSDAIPSSSSDANISQVTPYAGSEDPISSTSDSITNYVPVKLQENPAKSTLDAEEDIFSNDLNISDVPSEKITENVEDIVNDLENLLEEGSCQSPHHQSSQFTVNTATEVLIDDSNKIEDSTVETTSNALNINEVQDDKPNIAHNAEIELTERDNVISTSNEVENVENEENPTTSNASSDEQRNDKKESEQSDIKCTDFLDQEATENVPPSEPDINKSSICEVTDNKHDKNDINVDKPVSTKIEQETKLSALQQDKILTNQQEFLHQSNINENVLDKDLKSADEESISTTINLIEENVQSDQKLETTKQVQISEDIEPVLTKPIENVEILKDVSKETLNESQTDVNIESKKQVESVSFGTDCMLKSTLNLTTNNNESCSSKDIQTVEAIKTDKVDIMDNNDCTEEIVQIQESDHDNIKADEFEAIKSDTIDETQKVKIIDQVQIIEMDKLNVMEIDSVKNIETDEATPIEDTKIDEIKQAKVIETDIQMNQTATTKADTLEVMQSENIVCSDIVQDNLTKTDNVNFEAHPVNIEINKVDIIEKEHIVDKESNNVKGLEVNLVNVIENDDIKIIETDMTQEPVNAVEKTDRAEDLILEQAEIENIEQGVVIGRDKNIQPIQVEVVETDGIEVMETDKLKEEIEAIKKEQIDIMEKDKCQGEPVQVKVTESEVGDKESVESDQLKDAGTDKVDKSNANILSEVLKRDDVEIINKDLVTIPEIAETDQNKVFAVGEVIFTKHQNDEIQMVDNDKILSLESNIQSKIEVTAVEHMQTSSSEVLDIKSSATADEYVELSKDKNTSPENITTEPKQMLEVLPSSSQNTESALNKIRGVAQKHLNIEDQKIIIVESSNEIPLTSLVVSKNEPRFSEATSSSCEQSNKSEIDLVEYDVKQSTSGKINPTKVSKLVVELSVADTTGTDITTSDNDMQSENEKESEVNSHTVQEKLLKIEKPDTEINKLLTIEVDDIQSETYETSNDETLEGSSRSDLEDSKPEYSSRISKSEDLKMTITKQKPDEFHSILKIYDPADTKDTIPKFKIKSNLQDSSEVIPKISLKALMSSDEQSSPKRSQRIFIPGSSDSHSPKSSKLHSPNSQKANRKSELLSPLKLTIKPVKLEDTLSPQRCSPKITIKPITKPDTDLVDNSSKGSPKIIIKPIIKPEEDLSTDTIKSNPKITIKPIIKPEEEEITLLCKNEEVESHRVSPKIIIKPVLKLDDKKTGNDYTFENIQGSSKITIKPIHKHDEDTSRNSPKVTVRSITKPEDDLLELLQSSPKITIKPVVRGDEEELEQSRSSPKITIKPIIKPDEEMEYLYHNPKITIKPIINPDEEESAELSRASPKITIKPVVKSDDNQILVKQHSPKITIKALPKPSETEMLHSPRITIKPITKPDDHKECDYLEDMVHSPKVTIKPIHKTHETVELPQSPRITIKPIVKPQEDDYGKDHSLKLNKIKKSQETSPVEDLNIDYEEQIKQERIVLKIHKNTIPCSTNSRKRELIDDEEKSEKLGKIKLKLSKEDGHAQIVTHKRLFNDSDDASDIKRMRPDDFQDKDDVLEIIQVLGTEEEKPPPPQTHEIILSPCKEDPLDKIPVFEITPESAAALKKSETLSSVIITPVVATPRKRGRPRKVPLEVREEFKDENQIVPQPAEESTRPKRSCRGPSVRMTLGIKPRKPRGPGRGRGGKRGMGTGRVGRPPGRPKLSATKLKLLKETVQKPIEDGEIKENKVSELVMIEEETRMSAETSASSRAQTPAKQNPDIEESQSSVQSTATTESAKARRSAVRHEVYQEPEGAVISADQLAEYYWGGGGPYMLQEQVAQFLGIKSFKRKYPGMKRRPVEMQERDFIREQSLASEAMCDLGLTAVNSSDILDIMYSDFQYKYEEYCKHQRDRQVKELSNKQKALSLVASQEKNTIAQQAVQSAANWNANFNRSRKEDRKACMDLQTLTVHYPKGRMKQINKPKIGNYPLALVPGQYTDYYKKFTPTELNNLPLNTVCYDPINVHNDNEDSQSECSGSESDSSSSSSDSSSSDSSDEECNMCTPPPTPKNILAH